MAQLTVIPASTQAGKATISALLSDEKTTRVVGIYRDLTKIPSEFKSHPKFIASQGDIASGASLDFSNSDAVLYIPPPIYDGSDVGETARKHAENVKEALAKASSVKRLVLFSSMGSQYDRDIGILRVNYISDQILKDSVAEVVIPRPGYFQENWQHAFQTLELDPPVFYSPISPATHKIPMISIEDIGTVCAQKLLEVGQPLPSNPHFFNLYGPRNYSSLDVKSALEEITGKVVEAIIVPKDQLASFFAERAPASVIQELVDMTTAALPGGIMVGTFEDEEGDVRGPTELVETLRKIYQF
ncbi:unnamed protein product [Clonostachys rosea f. rosea IK726]|uniref:Uncharacterized protein n=1 Tax=Clonostachys rosea f. rosea IK726 TaxID=1349383 RepID=A0ACA9UJJ6_BIOOC|nr:unnamed protein product [Clonostachys rosea f. rosea IK726]